MNKFTPGPWSVYSNEYTYFLGIEGGTDSVIMFGQKGEEAGVKGKNKETRLANARLIAAAPELLEATRLALAVAESWIHDQLDGTSLLEDALKELDAVRDAIAKAEGKQ